MSANDDEKSERRMLKYTISIIVILVIISCILMFIGNKCKKHKRKSELPRSSSTLYRENNFNGVPGDESEKRDDLSMTDINTPPPSIDRKTRSMLGVWELPASRSIREIFLSCYNWLNLFYLKCIEKKAWECPGFRQSTDLPFLVLCTTFTTQDVNEKISVKVNAPYRLHENFITYRFLKVPWQSEQGLEDRGDQCVSKSGTISSFFFIPPIGEACAASLLFGRLQAWRWFPKILRLDKT